MNRFSDKQAQTNESLYTLGFDLIRTCRIPGDEQLTETGSYTHVHTLSQRSSRETYTALHLHQRASDVSFKRTIRAAIGPLAEHRNVSM